MLNKQQAKTIAPLVNNPQMWEILEAYLTELKELVVGGMMVAQSESELRQLQGKLALLETLLKLKHNHKEVVKNG